MNWRNGGAYTNTPEQFCIVGLQQIEDQRKFIGLQSVHSLASMYYCDAPISGIVPVYACAAMCVSTLRTRTCILA